MKFSQKQILIFSVIILSIILGLFIWQIINLINTKTTIPIIKSIPTIIPTPTPDPDRPISILLLGYGGGTHDGGSLTDSIMVAQVRPHDQKINLISIPRDLWINVSTDSAVPKFAKINYLYPSTDSITTKSKVGEILGINIDYYLALDFNGFTKAIDQLGGIDLKIVKNWQDPWYPLDIGTTDTCNKSPDDIKAIEATMSGDILAQQYTCRYETLNFSIGTTHLDGITALKYARSRHSPTDGGDFNRGLRQRQVIIAIRDKIINPNNLTKIFPIIKTLKYHLYTDITTSDIEKYLLKVYEFSKYKTESYALTDKNVLMISTSNRQSILIPTSGINQYDAIKSYVASISAKL
ncbi:MAG: LCP family protein [Candidatus Shapirobacteria bacterium]